MSMVVVAHTIVKPKKELFKAVRKDNLNILFIGSSFCSHCQEKCY
jgi:hypothetical protein